MISLLPYTYAGVPNEINIIFRHNSDNTEVITKVLLFNTTGQRNSERFMEILSVHKFDVALFTTNVEYLNTDDCSDVYNNNVTNEEQYERAMSHLRLWEKITNGSENENCRVRTQLLLKRGHAT